VTERIVTLSKEQRELLRQVAERARRFGEEG
jgi:hypothetical protein